MMTPVKKPKSQVHLNAADAWLSRAVSRVRQPIESLFNWIEEKTGIEMASKVRSSRVFLSMSSGAWPPLCLCGMSCRKALNSH